MSDKMLNIMERHNDAGNNVYFTGGSEHKVVENRISKFEFLQIAVTAILILLLAFTTIWGKIILMKMGVFASDLQNVIKLLVLR